MAHSMTDPHLGGDVTSIGRPGRENRDPSGRSADILVLTPAHRVSPPERPRGRETTRAPDRALKSARDDRSDRSGAKPLRAHPIPSRFGTMETGVEAELAMVDGPPEPAMMHLDFALSEEIDEAVAVPSVTLPFDENHIRMLVSQAVRDEFRGGFGQGVTRTIRHLVRREVMRVLAVERAG